LQAKALILEERIEMALIVSSLLAKLKWQSSHFFWLFYTTLTVSSKS